MASCGISASVSWNGVPSKSCWFAMLEPGAGGAHHASPYVGPRPSDMGVPSHGGPGTAPAGAGIATAEAASAKIAMIAIRGPVLCFRARDNATSLERPFEPVARWYPWHEPQKRWVGATARLTPPACVPTIVGRATPSSWSPFLRVGARTLRTEQCAKSQCVYPVDIGRCGSPCLPARRSYGKHHRKADPGVLLGEADFPTHEPETGPQGTRRNQTGAGSNGSLRRV